MPHGVFEYDQGSNGVFGIGGLVTDVHVVASDAAMLAIPNAHEGSVAVRTDLANAAYINNGGRTGTDADWTQIGFVDVVSVAGKQGVVTLASTDLTDSTAIARLASPAFTGHPTGATETALNNSTRLSSTAYADAAVGVEAANRATADGLLIPLTQRAAANGVATLDSGTKVPSAQLPSSVVNVSSNWQNPSSLGGWPNGDVGSLGPDAILEQFQSGNTWTQFGTGALTADTSDYIIGTQSLQVVTNGAGAQSRVRNTGYASRDWSYSAVRVKFKVTGLAFLFDLKIRLGSGGLANYFEAALHSFLYFQGAPTDTLQAAVRDGEWITVTVPWSKFATGAGSPNRANITDYEVMCFDNSGGSFTLHVNEIAQVPAYPLSTNGGIITFWFDDGLVTQYTAVMPKLGQYGFGATLPVICDMIGGSTHGVGNIPFMSLQQLQNLEWYSNWEIATHAYLNANHGLPDALASLTTQQCEADWENSRLWLESNGLGVGRDIHAYPNGKFTIGAGSMERAARKHLALARTIDTTRMEATPPQNPYRLMPAGYAFNTTTLASLKALVDKCQVSGGWLNFVFHNITPTVLVSTDYLQSDFNSLVDYVAASGVPVMTASRALRAINEANTGRREDVRARNGSYRKMLLDAQGLKGENWPHEVLSTSSVLTSGTVYYALIPFTQGDIVTNLWVSVGTAGSTFTLTKMGVYHRQSLAQLATSADVSASSGFGSAGNKSVPLSAPWTCPATGLYYAAFVSVATTPPSLARAGNQPGNAYRFGTNPANFAVQTAQADLPGTAVLTQDTFSSLGIWVGWN